MRVVAVTPCEFVEEMRGVFSRDRQFDGDQQFIDRQRGLINPLEEIHGRNSPLTGLSRTR